VSSGGRAGEEEGTLGREVCEEQREVLGYQEKRAGQGPLRKDSSCLGARQESDNWLDSKERAQVTR